MKRLPHRVDRVARALFDAYPAALTAAALSRQTHVRVAGVRYCLRLMERVGQAERADGQTTADGRPLWRWHDKS